MFENIKKLTLTCIHLVGFASLLSLVTGVLGLHTNNSSNCTEGFVKLRNSCYYFHMQKTSYDSSIKICKSKGSALAQITSAAEEVAITNYIEENRIKEKTSRKKKFKDQIKKATQKIKGIQERHNEFCAYNKENLVHASPYNLIPDKKVPYGHSDKAKLTTPNGFSIRNSSIPGAGLGAWTDIFLPAKTVLGFYDGRVTKSPLTDTRYAWVVNIEGEPYWVDAIHPNQSNWLRYVNTATKDLENNVAVIICDGRVFYMTRNDITPNTELMVSYGMMYDLSLGINQLPPEHDIKLDSWQIRIGSSFLKLTDNNLTGRYTNFSPNALQYYTGHPKKVLLSYSEGKWNWILDRDYSYFTDISKDFYKYPFICEKRP